MNSRDYWAKRSALDMVRYMRTAEQTANLMEKAGAEAARFLSNEVQAVYRGLESFGISEREARRIMRVSNNKTVLQMLRSAAAQVSDEEKRSALLSAINSAGAYRYRIDRMEQINRQITQTCNDLYKTQLKQARICFGEIAEESYLRTIFNVQKRVGFAFGFEQLPRKAVDRILGAHWVGGSYSQRIWKNTEILADRLKDELLVGMLSGRSPEKTARIIRETFGSTTYCARRLVRTESAYVSNAAVRSGYEEAGIDRYRFVATLDSHTSEICAELDGKVFPVSEAKAGTNLPPMHPWCRSTTIAEIDESTLKGLERRARDKDGKVIRVPADMTYSEWKEKYGTELERPEPLTNDLVQQAKPADTVKMKSGKKASKAQDKNEQQMQEAAQEVKAVSETAVSGQIELPEDKTVETAAAVKNTITNKPEPLTDSENSGIIEIDNSEPSKEEKVAEPDSRIYRYGTSEDYSRMLKSHTKNVPESDRKQIFRHSKPDGASGGYVSTHNYSNINSNLRGDGYSVQGLDDDDIRTIEALRSAINSNTIDDNYILTRYVDVGYLSSVFGATDKYGNAFYYNGAFEDPRVMEHAVQQMKDKIGTTVQEKAFVSTSVLKDKNIMTGKGVRLTISAPAGTNCYIPKNKKESECILGENTAFYITDVRESSLDRKLEIFVTVMEEK